MYMYILLKGGVVVHVPVEPLKGKKSGKTNNYTYMYNSVFDKLIWRTIGSKQLHIWHCTVLSLGQMAQLIMSLIALTLC